MPSTSAITISYELNPPAGVDASGLEKSKSFEIAVNAAVGEGQKAFYNGLRSAIADVQRAFGEDLTVWRDRVGKAELMKEPKAKDDDDDEEEEEEDAA